MCKNEISSVLARREINDPVACQKREKGSWRNAQGVALILMARGVFEIKQARALPRMIEIVADQRRAALEIARCYKNCM